MSASMLIGGAELVEQAQRADNPCDLPRLDYLHGMLSRGPDHFIDNARVAMSALRCGSGLLPLVESDNNGKSTEICDLYTHYVGYLVQDLMRQGKPWASRLTRERNRLAQVLFVIGSLKRALYLDNFLLSTNPALRLDTEMASAATQHLVSHFPSQALVVRSVNPDCDRASFYALKQAGFQMIRSRTVYLFDVMSESVIKRSNNKTDARLMKRHGYRTITDISELKSQSLRLTDLYRHLYLNKHPDLNPACNHRFFELALDTGMLNFVGFSNEGSIDAFATYFIDGDFLVASSIGYDLSKPKATGLYRIIIAWLIGEARKQGLRVNISSGSGSFKKLRGGEPSDEFDAVYYAHLPARTRFSWNCMQRLSNRYLKPSSPAIS